MSSPVLASHWLLSTILASDWLIQPRAGGAAAWPRAVAAVGDAVAAVA